MRPHSNVVWLVVLPLAACAMSPPLPQQLVSVGAVMNSLMCGMVKAHQNPEAARFLNGQRASVTLELKIVNSSTAGISIGGGGGGGGASGGGGKGGKGGRVKSRAQAIAIGLSEARKKGAKVPRKRASSRRKRASSRS